MGKNLKGKECGKGIYQRRMVYIPQDTMLKTESARKNILKRCRKQKTGLLMQGMKKGIA